MKTTLKCSASSNEKTEISSFDVNLPEVSIEKIKNWVGNQFAPLLLDAGLQAMLVKGRELTKLPSLPLSIDSGSFLGSLRVRNTKSRLRTKNFQDFSTACQLGLLG